MPNRQVHEKVIIRGEVGRLNGLLAHHTYRDWADQRRRADRYATLWAEQRFSEGKVVEAPAKYSHALWRFIRGYLIKRGFLDGGLGFRIALACAMEVYRKYQALEKL